MRPTFYPFGFATTGIRRWLSPASFLLVVLLWLSSFASAWAQCSAPTGLSIANLGPGTATLTFTGPATASSYTISYTFVGGTTATPISPNPTASPVQLTGLPFSASVTVSVAANCAGGATSPTATFTFTSAAGNDEPCTAIVLPLNATNNCNSPLTGTTFGATPTPANGYNRVGCGANGFAPADVWYTLTTAATGASSTGLTITSTGGAAGQLRLFSASSCQGPFTEVACVTSNSTNTSPPLVVAGLSPSTTYYLRVAGYSTVTPVGAFTLCAGPPPACGDPINLAVGSIGATTAQLTFAPGPGNVSYLVSVTPQGGSAVTLPIATGSPVTLPNLQPLTTYTVSLRATCANGNQGTFLTTTFTTGNAYDEPAGALPLTSSATCQPTAATTQGATTTGPTGYTNPGCGGASTQPNDVWFRFTTAASGLASTGATITVNGVDAGQVRVFGSASGAAGPFTEVGCAAGSFTTAAPPLVVAGLSPNTTYYVSVAAYNATATSGGPFTICLTPPPACPAPTRLSANSLGTTTATLSWQVPSPGGTYSVEYGPTGFAPGTGAGTVVAAGTASTLPLTGLTPNTSYDFYVSRDCGTAGASARSGPATFRTAQVAGPANDDICQAAALPQSGATCATPTAGTLVGASFSGVFLNGSTTGTTCAGSNSLDVWYTFTTAATGPTSTGALLQVRGATSLNVLAATGCTGPVFTRMGGVCSNQNGVDADPLVVLNLTPNTRYYVQVAIDNRDTQRPFTICLSNPPACSLPTNLGFAQNGLGNTFANLFFVPGAGNTSYTLTVNGPNGFSQTQTATTSPAPITGLTPSTTYTATLVSNCAAGQGLPLSYTFTTLAPGPANQTCATALPISCGQRVMGNTTGALSFVGLPGGGCGSSESLVYRFAGTGDLIQLSICSPATSILGAAIYVLSGTCANLSCVPATGAATTCPAIQSINFPSRAGTDYYFIVSTAGYTAGGFELTATCLPPLCAVPTAVLATAITNTTANVGFTPGLNSLPNGYTLTATPATGGAVITATGTASPIALTGLAPGTTYTVSLVANCGTNTTSPAAITTFATSGTLCPVPTALSVGAPTATGATVSFTGAAPATGFTLTATPTTGPVVTLTGTGSPLTLTGLLPSTTYTLRLVANCPAGGTSAAVSGTLTTTGLPCLAPTNLATGQLTPTSASISFLPATGGAASAGYTVTATPTTGLALTFNGSASPVALTGLLPNTAYSVTIVTNCSATSNSPVSAALNLRTLLASRNSDLAAQISLYPNPAHHTTTLVVPATLLRKDGLLTLSDALGRTIQQRFMSAPSGGTGLAQAELDLTSLPAGVYSLRIMSSQGPLIKRLVIE